MWMYAWHPGGNSTLVRQLTSGFSISVFPRTLNSYMQWCRFDSVKGNGIKGEKGWNISGCRLLVLGGILSDGVGHTHMYIYSACIHAHKGLIKCLHHCHMRWKSSFRCNMLFVPFGDHALRSLHSPLLSSHTPIWFPRHSRQIPSMGAL